MPSDDLGDLFCAHDSVPVSANDPRCLHPTSWCEFRQLCLIAEAERTRKRRQRKRHDAEAAIEADRER